MRPEALLGKTLREKGMRLGAAESCTGGLFSSMVTDIAGSSDYFIGSVVAYSNEIKKSVLGVRQKTLKDNGAVSSQTALEMAEGIRKALKADIGIGITGIAGPGGGTPEKPVGLVFIAVSIKKKATVKKFLFKGGRKAIKKNSALAALSMLLSALKARG